MGAADQRKGSREVTERRRPDDHPGEEGFLRVTGDETDQAEPGAAMPPRDRGLGTDVPTAEKQDSGFFGAGPNDGPGDDNLARESEPGYQDDKWDRGTKMPRG
jgi:hypothetical protein